MRRAVFLDRDGVVNQAIVRNGKPYPPRDLTQLVVLPGVAESLEVLRRLGFMRIIVTNQPDVARGATPKSAVDAIHARLRDLLPVDAIYTCWHDDADGCECRKPKPGLLIDAARIHDIGLAQSFMIGDRWRDIQAGQRAGCRTIWVDRGYSEPAPTSPDYTTESLVGAVDWVLKNTVNIHENGQ